MPEKDQPEPVNREEKADDSWKKTLLMMLVYLIIGIVIGLVLVFKLGGSPVLIPVAGIAILTVGLIVGIPRPADLKKAPSRSVETPKEYVADPTDKKTVGDHPTPALEPLDSPSNLSILPDPTSSSDLKNSSTVHSKSPNGDTPESPHPSPRI